MNLIVARAVHGLLDLVYPPFCLVCEARVDTGTLCERCRASFEPLPEPACLVCGRPQETARCAQCARFQEVTGAAYGFDTARAAAIYSGALRFAVHLLKYRNKENLALPLGAFLAERIAADHILPDADTVECVACVPMSAAKERARGYNQAWLLAQPVAEQLALPLLARSAVRRVRQGQQQMRLSNKARYDNVLPDAFAIFEPSAIAGKHILVVDDVFTTGTTVSAFAVALKQAGASRVSVATLAAGG